MPPAKQPLEALVPGDVVLVAAGDPAPAEVQRLGCRPVVDQASLTAESLPVVKTDRPVRGDGPATGLANIGLMGSHVTSGSARALVVATGIATGFGKVAAALATARGRSVLDNAAADRPGRALRRRLL